MKLLSEKFRNVGGQFNSNIYKTLVVMDRHNVRDHSDIDFDSPEEFTKLIRSIEKELRKVDLIEIAANALINIEENNKI